MEEKLELLALTPKELEELLVSLGEPKYRATQIFPQLHKGLSPDEMLVVDDLKPGLDMAHAAGVPFAAVGWAYRVPALETYMKENAEYYLDSVDALRTLLEL